MVDYTQAGLARPGLRYCAGRWKPSGFSSKPHMKGGSAPQARAYAKN
jgi:hypothetical protein